MKHTTGWIYIISLCMLSGIVGCQQEDAWKKSFAIESYITNLNDLAKSKGLDTFDIVTFEDYLLLHPLSGAGKTFHKLFLESDSFRVAQRKKVTSAYVHDTLLFRIRNVLVPDTTDAAHKNLLFKVFLHNLKSQPVQLLTINYPTSELKDSVWVDKVVTLDSLHVKVRDSIEIYTYPIPYKNGSYQVGSTSLPEPVDVTQMSAPEIVIENVVLVNKNTPSTPWPETVLLCDTAMVRFTSADGKPPAFQYDQETEVLVSVPCLSKECLLSTSAEQASIRVGEKKGDVLQIYVTPEANDFQFFVYATCLPHYFMQTTGSKEKKPISGRTLVKRFDLKAK